MSGGTVAAPAAVESGEHEYICDVQSYNGTAWVSNAGIIIDATEDHAVGSSGCRIDFFTTDNTTASKTLKFSNL